MNTGQICLVTLFKLKSGHKLNYSLQREAKKQKAQYISARTFHVNVKIVTAWLFQVHSLLSWHSCTIC